MTPWFKAASASGETLAWETASDWDAAQSESGVVHESVSNTDHSDASVVKQGQSVSNPYLDANLVGYWPLHEDSGSTAYGFGSVGNNGSAQGDPTVNATGTRGTTGWNLDGSGTPHDHISVPHASSYAQTGTVSVELWVDWNGANSADNAQGLISKAGSDAADGFSVFYLTSNNEFRSRIDGSGYAIGGSLSTGLHHIVWTHDQGAETVYVDGSSVGSTTTTSLSTTNSEELRIGCNTWSDSDGLNGVVQYAGLFDNALSSSEVQTLYDLTASQSTLTTAKKEI